MISADVSSLEIQLHRRQFFRSKVLLDEEEVKAEELADGKVARYFSASVLNGQGCLDCASYAYLAQAKRVWRDLQARQSEFGVHWNNYYVFAEQRLYLKALFVQLEELTDKDLMVVAFLLAYFRFQH